MDFTIFYILAIGIVSAYIVFLVIITKAKLKEKPKEQPQTTTNEPNQEQAFIVIQTLYNNQIINQQQYNRCITAVGLFKE